MRHRKQRVIETEWIRLNKVTHPKTGRKLYEVSVNAWKLSGKTNFTMIDIRSHFDPAGNRGGRQSTKWKYRDKETAEKLLTMALLKFGV